MVAFEITKLSDFVECETREATVLEICSKASKKSKLSSVIGVITTPGLRCEITARQFDRFRRIAVTEDANRFVE